MQRPTIASLAFLAACAALATSCGGGGGGGGTGSAAAESCMTCHNGSQKNDYAGPGIENPHPFSGASAIRCSTCHGGNPSDDDYPDAHVPPPPQIGDDAFQLTSAQAYFNRLTLVGIDKLPDYTVGGKTYSALDYLQFVNPGDLRVVTAGRACGQCHASYAESVARGMLATSTGIFSGATYTIGAENALPQNEDLYEDTAADLGFRAVEDTSFSPGAAEVGEVEELIELPVYGKHGQTGPLDVFQNPQYDAAALVDDQLPDGRVVTGSPLANLFHEQVAFTCGDCHLGSAGANNRAGDYRSSGCTACHMPYSLGGRSGSKDPNVDKLEPLDPDDIDPPERAHVKAHRILSRARTLSGGLQLPGIDDHACAGCHQGSNRTVMQYWGIRLDQNQDVRNDVQYPKDPVTWKNTSGDTRLFDPLVGNHTFNGRNANQYLLEEDYDGDGRDDTPPDVHYDAGLGCIDCHGSHDLHGDVGGDAIASRMEQAVSITCESCHGTVSAYATTVAGTDYAGDPAELAVDRKGNPVTNVVKEGFGEYWLTSRLTGAKHYVVQTRDVVVDTGKSHPVTGEPLYSPKASYAMGRADGNPTTGLGPQQLGTPPSGFSHMDDVSCAACHASWTNTCIGCHLGGEYNTGNNFSNITGDRIVFRQANADFVYQTPVHFQLGVGPDGKIGVMAANTDVFFHWEDRFNVDSEVFTFTDRNGGGANPADGVGALAHNVMMPHSIRGKVDADDEGPRYCVACHLTENAVTSWGTEYEDFRDAIQAGDWGSLDFALLRDHIGANPGNQLDSPMFVHMAAGLGSGMFLFDEEGCPVNPLDDDDDRIGCNGVAPASKFAPGNVYLDLDRIVDETGESLGSNSHPMWFGPSPLRDGASDPNLAGPLGASLLQLLTDPVNGLVLDSWLDADGKIQGGAGSWLGGN